MKRMQNRGLLPECNLQSNGTSINCAPTTAAFKESPRQETLPLLPSLNSAIKISEQLQQRTCPTNLTSTRCQYPRPQHTSTARNFVVKPKRIRRSQKGRSSDLDARYDQYHPHQFDEDLPPVMAVTDRQPASQTESIVVDSKTATEILAQCDEAANRAILRGHVAFQWLPNDIVAYLEGRGPRPTDTAPALDSSQKLSETQWYNLLDTIQQNMETQLRKRKKNNILSMIEIAQKK